MEKIINPWEGMEGYFCFGCAPNNESGLKMEFYEDGDEIVSKWVPEARFQGWLNTLHGGIQATLLDEICAWVIARKLQTAGVTSRMETQYLKPIHTTDSHLTLKGRIKEQKRNFVFIEAEIYNAQDEVCTKAVCTYFIFPREKAEKEIARINKLRSNHYEYYTERGWETPSNYDICVNSDSIGINNVVDLICSIVEKSKELVIK